MPPVAQAAKYSHVEGSKDAISPGVRTIPAPIVLPIATAMPKPTPSVVIRRPRPDGCAPTKMDFVPKRNFRRLLLDFAQSKIHHSRAHLRRKQKLRDGNWPQMDPHKLHDWIVVQIFRG